MSAAPRERKYYSVNEVAALTGLYYKSVYRLIYNDKLRVVRYGRTVRIPDWSLAELMRAQQKGVGIPSAKRGKKLPCQHTSTST